MLKLKEKQLRERRQLKDDKSWRKGAWGVQRVETSGCVSRYGESDSCNPQRRTWIDFTCWEAQSVWQEEKQWPVETKCNSPRSAVQSTFQHLVFYLNTLIQTWENPLFFEVPDCSAGFTSKMYAALSTSLEASSLHVFMCLCTGPQKCTELLYECALACW